jgi:hypothetical protein
MAEQILRNAVQVGLPLALTALVIGIGIVLATW